MSVPLLQVNDLKKHFPVNAGLFGRRSERVYAVDGVSFEIERVKGIKNILFGADSLFLAKLTGPGKVFLQTLPLANLAGALRPYMEFEGGTKSSSSGGLGGAIGGLLGS